MLFYTDTGECRRVIDHTPRTANGQERINNYRLYYIMPLNKLHIAKNEIMTAVEIPLKRLSNYSYSYHVKHTGP